MYHKKNKNSATTLIKAEIHSAFDDCSIGTLPYIKHTWSKCSQTCSTWGLFQLNALVQSTEKCKSYSNMFPADTCSHHQRGKNKGHI
jgi:hypothetical protein